MEKKSAKMRKRTLWIWACLHGVLLIIFTLLSLSFAIFTLDDEVSLIKYSSAFRNLILTDQPKPPSERFLFVSVSWEKTLIEKLDEDSFTIGYQPITDRLSLGKFIKKVNQTNHAQEWLLVDVRFDLPTSTDSLLAAELGKVQKTTVSYHKKEDDSPDYPIFKAPIGLSDMESTNDMVLKYHLVQGDSLKTTPLIMYESIHNKKYQKGTFFDFIDQQTILNTFILDFKIRPYDLEMSVEQSTQEVLGEKVAQKRYRTYYISELLDFPDDLFLKAIKDKIVVLGDFHDRDIHPTIYGKMPGPLILLNAFLALEAGDHHLSWYYILFLWIGYTLISYKALQNDLISQLIKKKVAHLPFGEAIMGVFSYFLFFILMSLLSFFFFNTHLTILILSFYMHVFEKIIEYFLYSKKTKASPKSD